MCTYVCVCVCVSPSVYVCVFVCASVCLSVYVFLCVPMDVCVCLSLRDCVVRLDEWAQYTDNTIDYVYREATPKLSEYGRGFVTMNSYYY